jgi:hypothetical protein
MEDRMEDNPDTRAWIEPFQRQLDRVRAAGMLDLKREVNALGCELSKMLFDLDARVRVVEARSK